MGISIELPVKFNLDPNLNSGYSAKTLTVHKLTKDAVFKDDDGKIIRMPYSYKNKGLGATYGKYKEFDNFEWISLIGIIDSKSGPIPAFNIAYQDRGEYFTFEFTKCFNNLNEVFYTYNVKNEEAKSYLVNLICVLKNSIYIYAPVVSITELNHGAFTGDHSNG